MHSIIVSWKPPEFQANDQEEEVTAYHVYADGQFRASVGGHEKRRALVENIDASKQHRISIRTVTSRGQSKDAECTLLVGKGASPAPTRLKASHITTNSCKLSWLPGSSNFYHAIFLNNHELRVCPPGVYKLFLTGLHPNTLHCVRVESKCSSGSNEPPPACQTTQRNPSSDELKRNAVTIEFHTAPVGLPSPPRNVQVEAGPQDGVLLISWRPVPQATHVFPKCENEQLVQGYTVCINDHPLMDVPGAERELKSGISILH
uniref:Fibronectin type-III domain-containing protein n=1 Tax=Mesocestoides corti TaxID=53468 RepID=A0A5K3FXJ2_MESCO